LPSGAASLKSKLQERAGRRAVHMVKEALKTRTDLETALEGEKRNP
jgi:hypothetical protein